MACPISAFLIPGKTRRLGRFIRREALPQTAICQAAAVHLPAAAHPAATEEAEECVPAAAPVQGRREAPIGAATAR